MKPDRHERERERLAALHGYGILDTPRETDFDDVTKILSEICDVPVSTVTLIDQDRQWHKAAYGIGELRETPRDVAFCAHTILADEDLVIVPDATKDPRFADNPFVTQDPNLRFYAAAVLRTEDGLPLGTVCVVDFKPRELDARQINVLQLMARQVMAQIALRREVAERRQAQKQQQLLIAELHHRVKNTLAVVQSVILLSLRSATNLSEFRDSISARIQSLANTHTLLTNQQWISTSLTELLTSELAVQGQDGRITLDGPDAQLPSELAVALGMCIHELMTNASKHGALLGGGRVNVRWTLDDDGDGKILRLRWTENGGPPVSPPARKGFGTILLQRLMKDQAGGEVNLVYAPEGLRAEIIVKVPSLKTAYEARTSLTKG